MVRGTTAQFKFNLPYNCTALSFVKITFWQNGNNGPATDRPLPIVKTLGDCHWSQEKPNELLVELTGEETLRFSDTKKGYVQLRAGSYDGPTFGSKQEQFTVYPVHDAILDNDIPIPPDDDGDGLVLLDGGNII